MAEFSKKWHNGTSTKSRSTKTSDGLAAIQAQLNNLRREIKKANEKVYVAHFGAPYQPEGQYRAAGPGFYQRNNENSSYPDQRPSLEESLTKFMAELAKRHDENSNIIKEIQASTDATIRNQGASIKTIEIQIIKMSKVLQERGFGSLPSSTETNPQDKRPGFYQRNNENSSYPDQRPSLEESLTKFMAELAKRHDENSNIIKAIQASTDAAIRNQGASIKTLEIQIGQMSKVLQEKGFGSLPRSTETNPRDQGKSISTAKANFSEIHRIGCGPYAAQDVKILEAYDHTLPQKEEDPESFTLPYFIHNICFDKSLVDLGANFIILDIPEDDDVPLILERPFLSTAHSKIDVFKRNITLRIGEEKLVFKSIKPATGIIKRVFVIKSLDSKIELIGEGDESFDLIYGNYIELNDLDTPLEPKMNQDVDFEPTFVKTNSKYCKMNFSCIIRYKYVNADLIPSLSINLMFKIFYYSIIKDKDEGKSHAGTLIDIPVFVRIFSIIIGFTIIDGDDVTKDVMLGMKFCKKYASCQLIMKKSALGDKCERIMEDE
ncbi:hypothetical protein Tco_0627419 [Tanacetum coccineum]|uniref:Reverse transcriptase domain-containing protein n=1 Tax=Tanacetum coccineum TaxID=301880 RepID=A0ABQ4WMH2_9ASTR